MGKSGYPLLFQTGETADGRTPLIDRQHPHDLLMEAALTYSHDFGPVAPPSCMRVFPGSRRSGPKRSCTACPRIDNPEAPLSHHWLDSTHVSLGRDHRRVRTGAPEARGLRLQRPRAGPEPLQHRDARARFLFGARHLQPIRDLSLQAQLRAAGEPRAARAGGERAPQTALGRATTRRWRAGGRRRWPSAATVPPAGRPATAGCWSQRCSLAAAHYAVRAAERVGKDELFLPGQPLYGRPSRSRSSRWATSTISPHSGLSSDSAVW